MAKAKAAEQEAAAPAQGGDQDKSLEQRVVALEEAYARIERAAQHLTAAAADVQAVQGHVLRTLEAPSQEERGRGSSLIRAAYYRIGTGVQRARDELGLVESEDPDLKVGGTA